MNIESLDAPRKNIDFVSYSDQGGRGDGVQIMVHKGHAYIGHMFSNGVTVMDVSDPKGPTGQFSSDSSEYLVPPSPVL